MAEAVGVAGSIVAIIQLTTTVLQYIHKVRDASEERLRIHDEISSAGFLLYILKDRAENAQSEETLSTVKSLNVPSGPLEQFKAALERLTARLAPVQGLKTVGKAVAWPFKKAEVKEILSTIERQKSLFNLALQNDHVYGFRPVQPVDGAHSWQTGIFPRRSKPTSQI